MRREAQPRAEEGLDAQPLLGRAVLGVQVHREAVAVRQKANDDEGVGAVAAEPVGLSFADAALVLHVADAEFQRARSLDLLLQHGRVAEEPPAAPDPIPAGWPLEGSKPLQDQEVLVLGEVQNATSQLYQPDWSREDYIQQSGGETRLADKSHIYVVRADGRVVAQERGFLFSHARANVKPGDAIVVPMNVEKMPALPMWQSVTQILWNGGAIQGGLTGQSQNLEGPKGLFSFQDLLTVSSQH